VTAFGVHCRELGGKAALEISANKEWGCDIG